MRFWTKDLQKSISGFPTRVGLRTERDLRHALWLLRLSYVRYALKAEDNPRKMFEQESENLHLSPQFASLLAEFMPAATIRGCLILRIKSRFAIRAEKLGPKPTLS
jgi:hypothetical protein